jgi:hypothetical protein
VCSISRAPRREKCAIYTAVAPEAVFTRRTNVTNRKATTSISAQIQAVVSDHIWYQRGILSACHGAPVWASKALRC